MHPEWKGNSCNFRLLPFENRKELPIAVFTMPLRVIPDENQRLDALMGEKDFELKTTICGSPPPDVKWFVDGVEVLPDEGNFRQENLFQIIFKLSIGLELFACSLSIAVFNLLLEEQCI